MRVSRAQFAQNREKIIDAASELFLDKGFSAIGVAEVMKAAGFTHGGFYGHFDSKEQLAYETSRHLFHKTEQNWKQIINDHPEAPLEALFDFYLSSANLSGLSGPCALSSLSQELGRQSAEIRSALAGDIQALSTIIAELIPAADEVTRGRRALAAVTAMIGSISLARATDDPALAEAILSATKANLLNSINAVT
ncbi:TetR/AcrR family transcriptional regulator [Rhizobium sp. Rhizsp42]|uniref:TetR/AcrR family transcriptional regulator n=1 Tax=Rhizobium sp. Rhizsp42 TaxID=3243034 RepID=UPI0039B04E4F